MKKILLIIIGIVLNYSSVIAQVPNSFRYQAVVRNSAGELVSNKLVTLKISILQGSALGASVYSEVFEYVTNEYGIVAVNIGSGVTLQGIFGSINWGSSSYYLQVEIDLDGGDNYTFMGASQILAVPYAMYALKVENADDADANPNNELQTISKSGNLVTLSNSGGSFIDEINDADADPTNEIQDLILSDNVLRITNNANATAVNLAAYQGVNTDEQTLSTNIIGNTVQLTIEGGTGGNTVSFQLPSDFVSRSSGGTFIGPIYASNLSGTNTGDMSNADVVSAYNTGFPDHFTSTDRVKLNGIEANATADMTNTEIVTAYQTGYPGYFNGADRSKLNSIETGATADMTNAEIVTAYNTGFADHFTSTDRIELNRLSLINNFTVSGGFSLQFVTQGNTSFTLPATSGNLATESFVTSNSLTNSLTTGRILVGESNIATPLNASGDGMILIGNGTTIFSRSIGGDATLLNTGNLTINSIGSRSISLGGTFTTTTDNIILNADAAGSNVTLPVSGTLATQSYVNSQISSNFQLQTGYIFVGNNSGVAVGVDLHGDADLASDGTLTVTGIGGSSVSSTDVTNWNATFSWGDHSTAGYMTTAAYNLTAASGIVASDVTNWNAAYGWGDHSAAGYLTSYTETDPIYIASVASGITGANVTNWNAAYGWGDHSTAGYLISYTETDPLFTASVASGITGANVTNWNAAYGWGDHSTAGYMTTTAYNLTPASGITSGDITNWNSKTSFDGAFTSLTSLPTTLNGYGITTGTTINISQTLNITPSTTQRTDGNGNEGDIYIYDDGLENHIFCYLNGVWVQLDN